MVIVWRRHPSVTEPTWTWHSCTSQRELKQMLLTGHTADVYDVSWSPHSTHLVTGSIDHTMIVWGVRDGCHPLQVVRDHRHYVQGVAWDPLDRLIVSQSSDRTVKLYANGNGAVGSARATANALPLSAPIAKKGGGGGYKIPAWSNVACKHTLRHRTMDAAAAAAEEGATDKDEAGKSSAAAAGASAEGTTASAVPAAVGGEGAASELVVKPKKRRAPQHRLFADENIASFFRRLAWTPDGAMLITPAALYQSAPGADEQRVSYGWVRGDWKQPWALYPGLKTPAVAVAACPLLWKLWSEGETTVATAAASTSASPASAAGSNAVASADPAATPRSELLLPYRCVWAVATHDEVVVYDTQHRHALVRFAAMHYAPITDLRWDQSGRSLAVSSHDGYCSFITFEEGELGEMLPRAEWPERMRIQHRVVFAAKAKKRKEESSSAAAKTPARAVLQSVVPAPATAAAVVGTAAVAAEAAAAAGAAPKGGGASASSPSKKKRRVMITSIDAAAAVVGEAFM